MHRSSIHKIRFVPCFKKQVSTKRSHSISVESNWAQSTKSERTKSTASVTSTKKRYAQTEQAKAANLNQLNSNKQVLENTQKQKKEITTVRNNSSNAALSSVHSWITETISITQELLEKELLMQNMLFSHPFTISHPFIENCSNIYQKSPQVILDHIKLLSEGHCIQSIVCLEGSEFTVSQLLDFCERLQEAVKVEKQKERHIQKLGPNVQQHMRISYGSVYTYLDFAVQFPALVTEDVLFQRHIQAQKQGLSDIVTDIVAGFIETNQNLILSCKDFIGYDKYLNIDEVLNALIDMLAYRITTQSHLRTMVHELLGDVSLMMADENVTFSEILNQPLRYYEWKSACRVGEEITFEPPNFDGIKKAVYDTLFSQSAYEGPEQTYIKMILDKAIDLGVSQLFQLLSKIKWERALSHSYLYNNMEEDLKRILLREKFEDTVLALDSYAGFALAIIHPTQGILYTKEFSKLSNFGDPFFLDTIADLTKQFRVKLVVVNNTGKKSAGYAPLLAHLAQKYPKLQQRQHTFNTPSWENALYKFFLPKSFNEIELPGRNAKTASYAVGNAVTLARVTIDPFEYLKYPELLPLGYYRLLLPNREYTKALLAIAGVLFIRAGADINSANKSSLSFLGMSSTLANQFLHYREKRGGYFRSKLDLLSIPTIPSHLASIFVPLLRVRDSDNAFDESLLAPSEYRYAASIINVLADVTKISLSDEDIVKELAKQLKITERQVNSMLQRLEYSHDYQPSMHTTPTTELEETGSAPVVGTWYSTLVLNFPLGYIGTSDWRYSYKTYPIGSTMRYKVEAVSPKSGSVQVSFPSVGES